MPLLYGVPSKLFCYKLILFQVSAVDILIILLLMLFLLFRLFYLLFF